MRGMYVVAGLALVLGMYTGIATWLVVLDAGHGYRRQSEPAPAASKQLCDAFRAWKAAAHDTSPGMDRLCK